MSFDIKFTRLGFPERMLNGLASLTMSTSVLEALPGKLDIKRHSPSILYLQPGYEIMVHIAYALTLYSRGTEVEKMLTLAPERYTAGFCMVAKVIIWCIWNHCIADSIDLHNARAVNFLRKPSKNMSKYYFSKCYIFLSKKFRIEKYGV